MTIDSHDVGGERRWKLEQNLPLFRSFNVCCLTYSETTTAIAFSSSIFQKRKQILKDLQRRRAVPRGGLTGRVSKPSSMSWATDSAIVSLLLFNGEHIGDDSREGSLWRLYWVGSGEGRSRFSKYFSFRRLDRSGWSERGAKLDRWFFGRVPPLLLRASTLRSPRVVAAHDEGGSLSSLLGGTEGGYIER
ncbi:hypothetical protein NL676_030762 [Syzygium grande]|nr:hypothetical protein NL676_030762 [Syzygium grande]